MDQKPSLRLAPLGGLLGWLLDRGVSSGRIGSLLDVTAANVRVSASRARAGRASASTSTSSYASLANPVNGEDRERVGLRPEADSVARTAHSRLRIDELSQLVDVVAAEKRSAYDFRAGITELRLLLPQAGYAASTPLIALKARIYEFIAWFHCHLGESAAALETGSLSLTLWRTAYQESGGRSHRRDFGRAVLPMSNAALLAKRPLLARQLLAIAQDASSAAGQPLGSDHLRQCGVAAFQAAENDAARKSFAAASRAMHDLEDNWKPASPLMASDRHISLLEPLDCDTAMRVLDEAFASFGHTSLESSMARNWAAAALLSSGDPALATQARELLARNAPVAARFSHQQTVTKLLTIAPELGLYPKLLRSYVRRALYENTASDR